LLHNYPRATAFSLNENDTFLASTSFDRDCGDDKECNLGMNGTLVVPLSSYECMQNKLLCVNNVFNDTTTNEIVVK